MEDFFETDGSQGLHDELTAATHEKIPPEEVFSALQNEVRIAVLIVLWGSCNSPLPYSEIKRRTPVESTNFNYHIEQLVGHFIRRTEDGYDLRQAGTEVIRTVIAGSITDTASLGPLEIDAKCPYCGSAVEIQYTDGVFSARCEGCSGVVRNQDMPRGTIMRFAFPPAGVVDRTPEEVFEAAHALHDSKITPMLNGVCPECAATVHHSLEVCDDHRLADDAVCGACDGRFAVWTTHECERCAYTHQFTPWFKILSEPTVIACYREQTDFVRPISSSRFTWRNALSVRSIRQFVLSTDPTQVQIELSIGRTQLRMTVDEKLDLINIERSALDDG